MNYEELDEIGAWLNSKGYDIDLKDDFWMEDCRFSEHKVRDVAELIIDYHQKKVKNLTLPRVMRSLPAQDIDAAITMLKDHAYSEEELAEVLDDMTKMDDSFAFSHAIIIKLLGGALDGNDA